MSEYEHYTKEELIKRIHELEKQSGLQSEKSRTTHEAYDPLSFKEQHGQKILDILPDMLSVFDYDYNFIALASSEKTVHVGGSSQNLMGKNLIEILPPDAYDPVKKNFDQVISTGIPSIGYHNLNVDGSIENFENRVIPLNDKYILCICRNITERIKAQNQLEMITSAVNNSQEEIYAILPDGTFAFANKQFINHYAIKKEITEYKAYDILPDETETSWKEYVCKIRANEKAINYTRWLKQADGKAIAQEISAYILKDNSGQEIIWTIARNITERIHQENKIRELNQLMDTILNNIPVYLFVKDSENDFRYLYWNREVTKVSGIPASRVIGKTDQEIFPESKDAEKFRQDDLQLLKDRQTIKFEEEYTTAYGERRIVHTIKDLILLEGRKPLLIGISWDITEQKKTEQELIKARNKAEESDKLKSAFLANMSHEIRTPLNAIAGFSKLLTDTETREERLQYADIIDKNTELLLQLINDILDLSKIEAGMLEFKEKEVCLNTLCQGIYETLLPRTPKGVKLIYQPYEKDIYTVCDSNRLAQVITNLLNNAHKFTSQGEISFGFRPDQNGNAKFQVKDTGIGITAENLNKIFCRFTKLNNFIQGTGLGLPICKMIIENMGGQIYAESEYGKGTTFHFSIPLRASAPIPEEKLPQIHHVRKKNQQLSILIAEDVESNFLLIKALIGKEYRLIHAFNGKEAVRFFEQESPDLILMDIKMPEMDGLEATKLIRQQSAHIPIIALTAFAYETDRQNALAAGCNAFLTKPVSASLLRQTLENISEIRCSVFLQVHQTHLHRNKYKFPGK